MINATPLEIKFFSSVIIFCATHHWTKFFSVADDCISYSSGDWKVQEQRFSQILCFVRDLLFCFEDNYLLAILAY